ncbi:hypothetical protein H696_03780 [Fonticula alba]|uniref:3-dehydrosphinganine reductase n=1 Tax=Fonticula alba TaxID=691883 RepID=A0A058Z5Y4_FONAL|nr:hypothetical protein H696_03780 [Fonticula alba]KCV69348.1 hypothetical protein H696_03780 [Fonticula alba]|eukprot:XP_009495913.1 hypothetical protein H696_03780 [Fonticula alba]
MFVLGFFSLLAIGALVHLVQRFLRPQLRAVDYSSMHALVTGGTKGLGRELALELARRGASVTVAARGAADVAVSPDQRFCGASCDVTSPEQVAALFAKAEAETGSVPDVLIPCAGVAIPGLFLDMELKAFNTMMNLNYFGMLNVVHEGLRRIDATPSRKGNVILISSTAALISFAGYSGYAPSKFAVRAFADALRNELACDTNRAIEVHMAYPPNMQTEGFEIENLTKPEITRQIEGSVDAMQPSTCARLILDAALHRGEYQISMDLLTSLVRMSANGVVPRSNPVMELVLAPILTVVTEIVARYFDFCVTSHSRRHNTASAADAPGFGQAPTAPLKSD